MLRDFSALLRGGAALATLCVAVPAWAQRGVAQDGQAPETPLSGFPGTFDTFVPEKGSCVLNLGAFGGLYSVPIDYGLTENLSIGTNGLAGILLLGGMPAVALKVRLASSPAPWLSFAATGYGLWARLKSDSNEGGTAEEKNDKAPSERIQGLGYMATFNTSVFLSSNTWLTGNISYLSLKVEQATPTSDSYERLDQSVVFAAATAQHFFKPWFGLRAMGAFPILMTMASDGGINSSFSGSMSLSAQASALLVAALGADFRLGRRWLLAPSFYGIVSDGKVTAGFAAEGSVRWW